MSTLLRAQSLVKSYGGRRVVDGVSFHVGPGEVVGLLGPNGAGKTTCFNMTVGLVVPDARAGPAGRARPHPAPHAPPGAARPRLPAAGSLHLPQAHRAPELHRHPRGAGGGPRRERNRRADELIAEYRLEQVAGSLGEQLSGGERRRAEVARSLLAGPRFILFDEPFAGVDPIAVGELQRLIGGLRDRGIGVLVTDHNVREALGICGRAYILAAGTILEAGTPAEIAGSARAREVYLGDRFRLDDHPGFRPQDGTAMSLELKQHLKMTQQLVMTPQLQQAIKLLQLSRMELVDLVRTEMTENPLLDGADENDEQPVPEGASPAEVADAESKPEHKEVEKAEEVKGEEGANEIDWDQYLDHYQLQGHTAPSNRGLSDEELPGYEATLTRKEDLKDHLEWQLRLSPFSQDEARVAMLIIGNLDEDGYFKMPRGGGGGRRDGHHRPAGAGGLRGRRGGGVGGARAAEGPAARPHRRGGPRPARVPAASSPLPERRHARDRGHHRAPPEAPRVEELRAPSPRT